MFKVNLAVILDFLIGDPSFIKHPVQYMGDLILLEDKVFNKNHFSAFTLKALGLLISIFNISLTYFIFHYLENFSQDKGYIVNIFVIYLLSTSLASKSLKQAGLNIYKSKNLDYARLNLSHIVGRDTENLNKQEVLKASLETISENTSDGVIAPLLYMIFFGLPGAMTYKMINTMDSMLAYKNDKYLYFGKYPALIDDIANYLPSRLTALLMILSAGKSYDKLNAFRIVKRDSRKHESPNAGFPESALAGLLNIALGGSGYYDGKLVEKASLGDSNRLIYKEDIISSIKLMFRTEILLVLTYNILYILGGL